MSTETVSKPNGVAQGGGMHWIYDLYRIGQAANADLDTVRTQILNQVVSGFSASTGCLAIADDDGDVLTISATRGLPKGIIGNRIEFGTGIMGKVAQDQQPVLLNGKVKGGTPARKSERPNSAICWPLVVRGRVIGALSVNRQSGEPPFNDSDLDRGRVIVNMIAVVVDNTRLYEKRRAAGPVVDNLPEAAGELQAVCQRVGGVDFIGAFDFEDDPAMAYAVSVMANLIGARSEAMASRCRRIAQQSHRMAKALGETASVCRAVLAAAMLHDIGRMSLPDFLLERPDDSLSDAQVETVRSHPVIGQAMLAAMPALAEVATLVRHHHESYDGSGYPDGLANASIPLGSRIIRVVSDFYGYQDGTVQEDKLTADQTVSILTQQRGGCYDPDLVDRLLDQMGLAQREPEVSEWCLKVDELKPGMVVIRDVKLGDHILLGRNSVLDAPAIAELVEQQRLSEHTISAYVRY